MNELQKLNVRTIAKLKQLNQDLKEVIFKSLNGRTVEGAVVYAFEKTDFENAQQGIIVGGVVESMAIPYASTQTTIASVEAGNWYLNHEFRGGIKLSDSLHTADMQKQITKQLDDFLKVDSSVYDYKKALKGVDSFDKLPKPINELFDELKQTGVLDPKTIRRAETYVATLDGRDVTELRKGYQTAIDMATKGFDSQTAIDKAIKSKTEYIQQRIVRTESTNAYDIAFNRKIADDDLVMGWYWILSPMHPAPDDCDFKAEYDGFGAEGYYPKGFDVDRHPNCLCEREEATRGTVEQTPYSEESVKKQMDGYSELKRAQIVGVGNAKEKNYIEPLKKLGFDGESKRKPEMLPKKFIEGENK